MFHYRIAILHANSFLLQSLVTPITYKILSNILLSRLIPYVKEIIGIINVAFDATGRLLIIYSAIGKYLRKNGSTIKSSSALHRLQESL